MRTMDYHVEIAQMAAEHPDALKQFSSNIIKNYRTGLLEGVGYGVLAVILCCALTVVKIKKNKSEIDKQDV